jgi:hypothetical protein
MQYAPTSPQWRGDSTPKTFNRSVAARGGDGVQPSIAQHSLGRAYGHPPPSGTIRRCVAHKQQPRATFKASCPGNCGGINESSRPLMGLGSGEQYESRFLRKCIDGGHAGIGHRRRAVGDQDFPRRVNKQGAGVEQETSDRRGSRRRHHFTSAAAEAFCSNCRRIVLPGERPCGCPLSLVHDLARSARAARSIWLHCECTGIISCSLSLPGNMTKGCVGSLTSRSRR